MKTTSKRYPKIVEKLIATLEAETLIDKKNSRGDS